MSIATQAQRVLAGCAALITAATLPACGDDDSPNVSLTLLTPSDGQVLTIEDDTEPSVPGVQVEVTGKSTGLRALTPIELYIDGSAEGTVGSVQPDGTVTLQDAVTLEPGEHTIFLRTAVGSVQSDDEHSYTLRVLVIEEPDDGDALSDQNDGEEGIQITVRTQSYALDLEGDIALYADDEEIATAQQDIDGSAVFEITLEAGEHTLQARTGAGDEEVVSEEVSIEVSEEEPMPPACDGVALLAPSSPSGAIVLGGADCEDGTVATRVALSIEGSDGLSAELQLNGATVGEAEIADGEVEFADVPFSGEDNELTLVIDGTECTVTDRSIEVDCAAPSCVIRSPVPLEVGAELYLSSAQLSGEGFDVEVEAAAESEGSTIDLVVDGDAEALTATAGEVDGDVVALFEGVQLADGDHTLSARCRDASGNVTETVEVSFTVDTTPCGVDITAPMADAVYLPADDSTPGTDGVQIGGIAGITGDDCVAARSGLCTGGELTGDFAPFDGQSPYASLLTLADGATSQSYCVEIQDRVGNVGGDEVAFMFRQVAPMVLIESPATGTGINAAGTGGRLADADGQTAACDAEITVACEVGTMVELHADTADGELIASGECVADDEAPDGYSGRAVIAAEVAAVGTTSATIIATQTFAGSSGELTGASVAVTYDTDCEAPVVVETNTPCSLHASEQITDEEAADFEVVLGDSSADTTTADLSYWIGDDVVDPLGDPTGTQVGAVAGGSAITFASIDFGDLGPLVVAVQLEDDFGNTTDYLCESEIVDELPSITIVEWPADGAEYGPGDSECVPEGGGEYGIQIAVDIDRSDDREVTLFVNGEAIEPAPMIDGVRIEYCVPLPDDSENDPAGPSTVRLLVEEIEGAGFDFVERDVSVHTIEITDPVEDELIVTADDCDEGAGFGVAVSVAVDPMHEGSDYTIEADAAAVTGTVGTGQTEIEACVPVTVGGERTITASIDGTQIEYAVTVNVVDDTPMIASIDSPTDGAQYGVGDQDCPATGVNTYGVSFVATLDQGDNRTAEILVNGEVAVADAPISDAGVIEVCLDVPDDLDNGGATTITLNVAAELGTGTATGSVEIGVDTLDIVDPVADQVLGAADDCIVGDGFGYEVQLAVDVVHLGRSYTITDGTDPVSGVIMDDSITVCVPLTPADPATITASIVGTAITESVEVTIEDPAPAIGAITAPANNAVFGPGGQTCDAGAGNYGVRVQATVDQMANRVASVLVNGVEQVADATIASNAIDACVAVPDNLDNGGASTITVRLEEEVGGRSDEASVTVTVDSLNITSPTASQAIGPSDDCDLTTGFGVSVSIAVDSSLAGETYVVDGGFTDLTGTVAGGTITGCLEVDDATTSITASITGTAITETVAVTVFTGGPPSTAIPFTSACPTSGSMGYRDAPATLTWGDLTPLEDYEGQFATLELRCAHTPLAMGQTAEAWWTAATAVALPGVTPDATGASLPFRVGETRYCALRAANTAAELSPMATLTNVTCGFRSQLLFAGSMGSNTAIGLWSAAVGDVNGDGLDDALVGGSSRVQLFFGRTGTFPGAPDVSFTSTANLGNRVAGLGDVNGDGLSDFAIAHASHNSGAGQVYVFFGRPASSPWPSSVALAADLTACGADLCFKHATNDARLGNSLASIGDFDDDDLMDIAIGAFTTTSDVSRLFIVLGGAYEQRACTTAADCRTGETCAGTPGSTCEKGAGQSFWNLNFSLPTGNWTNTPSGTPEARLEGFVLESNASNPVLSRGIAGLRSFDSTPGDDLIVQSAGNATQTAKLYFLSGRADPPGVGIASLTFSDLGFRASTGGAPSGTPFESTTRDTGNIMFSAGNIFDVAGGANPGAVDLLVKRTTEHHFYIYPGDNNFSPSNRIRMAGPTGSDLGISLTRGVHGALPANPSYPTPSMIGDLDGDGRPEFAAGTQGASGVPGQVYLWYADSLDSGIVAGVQQATTGSFIEPPAATGTQQRIVQFVGDLTGDGNPDLVVGNWQANSLLGEVYLLY